MPRLSGDFKLRETKISRTPPVPRARVSQTPPVPDRELRSRPRMSRHSIGCIRSTAAGVPSRSSSQGRLQNPSQKEPVKVVVRRRDKDEAGRTPLMHAARQGDVHKALELLRECPVDDTDSCRCTALMYAATYGHVSIAEALVDREADVNAQSHDKWTPLIAAVYNGHMHMADFLVSKGADIEFADERGWTALMHVAFNGRLDILRSLLQYGARVERQDREGRSALVYAAFRNHADTVKCLLDAGAGAEGAATLALMFAADKASSACDLYIFNIL